MPPDETTSAAGVIDGENLEVSGQCVHVHAIDAPEARPLCSTVMDWATRWQRVTKEMRDLIGREPLRGVPRSIDRYDRIVAVCMNQVGQDLVRESKPGGATGKHLVNYSPWLETPLKGLSLDSA